MKTNNTVEIKFREFLKETFESRIAKNPQYSMRSFAKALDINPATLSQILKAQRPITKKRVDHLIGKLDISAEEVEALLNSSMTSYSNVEHKDLSVDYFLSASEWFYDAILELTHLKKFIPSVKWVSSKLNLNYNQVDLAVERLRNLKLLESTDQGEWVDTSEHNLVAFDENLTNSALRKYQKQILEKSISSIDSVTRGDRDHTSFMLSMDDSLREEVHVKIKNFQKEIVNYIEENSKEKNLVQVIHFGSFPLTNLNNDN